MEFSFWRITQLLVTARNEVVQGNIFTGIRQSSCSQWGVSVQRESLSGRLCPEGSLSRGVSVWGSLSGVSVQGVSVWGVSVQGGLCPGGLCPGGLCPGGSLCRVGSVQGGLCLGGSLSSRSLSRGGFCPGGHLCPGGSLFGGLCLGGLCLGGLWGLGRPPVQ